MWRQFCWYRFVVSVNCVITQSLKTDYIFPTIFCIRTLFKFWDHLVGQNYFFRCTCFCVTRCPQYKTSGLLWDASEGTFKETYCVGFAIFLQILFPYVGSNFTRHPTLFLFCKEQLPVLGSSVCFVAAFGLVPAEQQSTVVNANTANTVNIVSIVNIQDWGQTIPSLLLTYTTCWWWFSDIITCSSNFFAKGEGRLLHFSTFPHFLFPQLSKSLRKLSKL